MNKSTDQVKTPANPPVAPAKRRWPDLSAYGIHFGVTRMPNGESRLVMVDEDAAWPQLARQLGFLQSRWAGVYSKASPRLDFKGMSVQFPKAKIVELTDEEIRTRIRPLLLAHRDRRLSQLATNQKRLSWHPTKTAVAEAVKSVSQPEEVEAPSKINPEEALRQTIYLGLNYQGQDVYESGDGARFIRSGDAVVATESLDIAPSPAFLRSRDDGDLVQVAAGMVREISAGKNLHSDDFIRYLDAAFGIDSSNDKEVVTRFHAALDEAMRNRVASLDGAGREAFDEALRMHEGRPSFWRAAGGSPTPLPLAVAMQSLAAAKAASMRADGVEPSILDITVNERSHSWIFPDAEQAENEYKPHDISLAGIFSKPVPELNVGGIRISRNDSKVMLSSLKERRDQGVSVFMLTSETSGRLDTEFKRVMSSIGQWYEVTGLVDLDSSLFGAGNTIGSRILVVGNKRKAPDYTFSIPSQVPVLFDYEALWNWSETVKALESAETLTFGDDGREENRWQAPYIPKSQISEPEAMSPRNLLGPVRKALAHVVERNGVGIDEYVCQKLGWTMAELESRLSAEQADATALGIQAIDDGKGFVTADMTGLGKGRVTAALAVYAKHIKKPVIMMTEKADLFTDFYRDVKDIGCMDRLGKPFIVNNNLVVRDAYTNKPIARSPSKDEASEILGCGEFPADYDIVLATYSQFNREFDVEAGAYRRVAANSLRNMSRGKLTPFEALLGSAGVLGMPDYFALAAQNGNTVDASFVSSYELTMAAAVRAAGNEELAARHEEFARYASLDASGVDKLLRPLLGGSMTTLKHQWAHSSAVDGALMILDESHVAAGDLSQTGINLCAMIERAGAVAYSSATFAKDIKNFRLYSRLFPSTLRVSTISETLSRGGEPMQEIASAMLAEDGRLVRREHDLSVIEFQLVTEKARYERNVAWADNFAGILAALSELSGEVSGIARKLNGDAKAAAEKEVEILEAIQAAQAAAAAKQAMALGIRQPTKKKKKVQKIKAVPQVGFAYTSFSSKLYNLARSFAMSLTADLAADQAIEALRAGRKPVVTVENTMESAVRELVEGVTFDSAEDAIAALDADGSEETQNSDELFVDDLEVSLTDGTFPAAGKKPEFIPLNKSVSFKDVLGAYVDAMFGAWEYTYSPEGKITSRKRISLANPALERIGDQIRKSIAEMEVIPLSPIDLVKDRISAAGFSVDEISGRTYRLFAGDDGNHVVQRMAKRNKLALKNAFNSGELNALILSKSGSTGISLHASRTFGDQSQRQLIELQPAADIAQRLQFWGRVNRKGQVCTPIVTMLSSGLPAENRLIAMQNNKLRRMSANTNGSSDNSAINENAPDILNKIGNEVCFRWMEANAKTASIIGFEIAELDEAALKSNMKFVDMLTGRMMMFPVAMQERIYEDITTEFNAVMEHHEMEGRNPLKSAEFDIKARQVASKVVHVAGGVESVFDNAVIAKRIAYDVKLPALSQELLEAEASDGRAALTKSHGKNYISKITNEVVRLVQAGYPQLLSKSFTSVEAALAENAVSNAVSRAAGRLSAFENWLPNLEPGSIIWLEDNESKGKQDNADRWNESDRLYVTGWKLPEVNKKSFASYKIVGWSLLKRKKVEIALSNIMSQSTNSAYVKHTLVTHGPAAQQRADRRQHAAALERFFEKAAHPFEGTVTRIVLEGNLYKAAEIADSLNSGQTITYSDEKGVWHHSILMPAQTTLENAAHMPVIVDSVEMIEKAAQSLYEAEKAKAESRSNKEISNWYTSALISDSFKNSLNALGQVSHGYRLHVSTESVELDLVNGKKVRDFFVGNKDLCATLAGGAFDSSKGNYTVGRAAPGKEREFLKEFMAIADARGLKVLLTGEMRPWYNEYMANKTGLPNTAAEVVTAALEEDAENEMNALLASP